MVARPVHFLSAGVVLVACASQAAERVRPRDRMAVDSDRQIVRPVQSTPIRPAETPPFPIDRKGAAAASTEDAQSRASVAPAPRRIAEEPPPR